MDGKERKGLPTPLIGAVITGIFSVVAALAGILLKDFLDQRRGPAATPTAIAATAPADPTATPAAVDPIATPVPTPRAKEPLVINGMSYAPPADASPRCMAAIASGDSKNGVRYKISVPDGWFVVWSSWKADWPGGSYDDNGLLGIYGSWEGTVTIVNGELCAVPVEWDQYAIQMRRGSAEPQNGRPEYYVNR